MSDRYLRFPALRAKTGMGRTTIWRMEKAGLFPQRRLLSARCVAWLESEVDAWMANCRAAKVSLDDVR